MKIEIQITKATIVAPKVPREFSSLAGAVAEFSGTVRDLENGETISALEYEAYSPMAENQMRQILESLAEKHPCLAATVVHRIGVIPVGETAIYICVLGKHRGEAFALLAEFMNRLKQDVPIWKVGSRNAEQRLGSLVPSAINEPRRCSAFPSVDEAIAEISSHCQALPGVRVNFSDANGRVLRETVCAVEDFPSSDRSTRDGFAILRDDISETFSIVDTLHAADWKPRQLKLGEAVRVATGASLPSENLRVVMQEDVERAGNKIEILRHETGRNVRQRGEEMRAGDAILPAGTKLNPGALALLATVGQTQPLVNPKLRVLHFTTGDEIISPDKKPQPGQIRDSNSILIRSQLEKFQCEVTQKHLPEDFERAKTEISNFKFQISNPPERRITDHGSCSNLLLVSGGASVGDKDFTRPLLEWLGFEIVFNRVNIRPGAPLIFGVNGSRLAFGLPGNPLSHFVCFHFAVATAIAHLSGGVSPKFLHGKLSSKLEEAVSPRETLWPARMEFSGSCIRLQPLTWASSGDVTCLATANALLRVPANCASLAAGAEIDFLPTDF
jgi:molybdopterin molybdotransferase